MSGVTRYGQRILKTDDLIEILMQGKPIGHLIVDVDEDIEKFVEHQAQLLPTAVTFVNEVDESMSVEEFHQRCMDEWFMPESYKVIDLRSYLRQRCSGSKEYDRIAHEMTMYEERGLTMLLRFFIYMVDVFRANKVVWGVGRGSSVNSYILYLIGVHRVDSLKYGLEIEDYLR